MIEWLSIFFGRKELKRQRKKTKDLDFISLFDGIGGFPLAWAKMLKIDHHKLAYTSSEIEPFLQDILKEQFPLAQQLGDIEKINLKTLSGDVVTMGTPCTGFSISGKGDGLENIESRLFKDGVEAIKAIEPEYFVWENVFGVYSANKRKEFREILHYFKETGYDLAWTLLDSKYFGIPQRRRRVYMLGVKSGLPRVNNIFDFKERQTKDIQQRIKRVDTYFDNNFDFNINSVNPDDHYAFFNRQRSDSFKEVGLSNTIAKRDYKSATDVVVKNGSVRRIVPKERLRLQGIPDYFFDQSYSKYKTDKPRYQANGMTVPVVSYVFEQIEKLQEQKAVADIDFEKDILITQDIRKEMTKESKSGELEYIAIPYSGQMFFKRDENGNILDHNEVEFHFAKKCTESSPIPSVSNIEEFLLDEVEEKYHLTKNSLRSFLRREIESEKPLPRKLKEVILHKHPDFKEDFKIL